MTPDSTREKTIFEKIVDGEIPCTKVYEDSNFLAFLDISPASVGHTLVVPKKHCRNIFDMPDEIAGEYLKVVAKLSRAIKKALNPAGLSISMNNEPAAGQIVFHAHIHLIPRDKDYKFGDHPHTKYKSGEAEMVAQKIADAIEK